MRSLTEKLKSYQVFDLLELGIAVLTREGIVLYANQAFEQLLCCNANEIKTCNFFKATDSGEDFYRERILTNSISNSPINFTDFIFSPNEERFHVNFKVTQAPDTEDILIQLLQTDKVTFSNLDVKRILKKYTYPIELDSEFTLILDDTAHIIGFDRNTEKLFQKSKDQLIGRIINELIIDEEISDLDFSELVVQTGFEESKVIEVRLKSEPNVKPFEVIIKKDSFQSAEYYVLKARDISARYEFETKLNHTLDLFNIITRYTTDVICIFNQHQELIYMNPVIKKLTGFDVDELMSQGFHNTILEQDRSQVQKIIKESVLKRETSSRYKYRQMRKDGSHFWLEVNAIRRYDRNGKIIQTIANLRDVDDQVKTAESILRHEKLLLETQKLASLGSWSYNIQEVKFYFGNAFAEMIGTNLNAYQNPKDFLSRTTPKHRYRLLYHWKLLIDKGLSFNVDFDFKIDENRTLSFNAIGYPELDKQGNILVVRGAVMDITSRKEGERRLVSLKEKAESAARAKHQFLSNMSHELRTPMNAVLGLSSLLKEEATTQSQKEKLDVLQFSAESLLHIIDDILDINALEENKLRLSPVEFNLTQHLENIHKIFEPKAHEKGLKLNHHLTGLPPTIILDKNRLNQVLYNLIGNAIKFTDKGEVSLKVIRLKNDNLLFEVSDTGIGIPEEELNQIFERFYRSNFSDNYKYSGTGLGLSISKRLLELMDSDLEVQSTINQGTKFYFEICPKCPVPDNIHLDFNFETEAESLDHHLRILAAEDNQLNQFLLKKILSKYNVSLTLVDNGLDAVNAYEIDSFDLVILDIQMPELNGLETARRIRAKDAKIPIIAMTAAVIEHEKYDLKKAGFNEILPKPFKPAELKSILAKITSNEASLN